MTRLGVFTQPRFAALIAMLTALLIAAIPAGAALAQANLG